MKRPRLLKYGGICTGCSLLLPEKTRGYWEKGRGVRCTDCGPHTYDSGHIVTIPQEYDSTRANPIGGRVRASGFVASQRKGRHRNR